MMTARSCPIAVIGLTLLMFGSAAHPSPSAVESTSISLSEPRVNNAGTHRTPPILFEPNHGQLQPDVQFAASAPAFTLFMMGTQFAFVPRAATSEGTIRLTFVDADPHPVASGLDAQQGRKSYFIGADSSQWRAGIPLYGSVRINDVYPGIDVVFYSRDHQLEYDFVLEAGADPNQMKLRFDGLTAVGLNAAGDLIVKNHDGEMIHRKPRMYQVAGGITTPVDGAFVIGRNNEVSFQVGAFRSDSALVIDPVVTYSSYLGGSQNDAGLNIRTDNSGAIYVMGYTSFYQDFPGPTRIFGDVPPATPAAFITKFAPNGESVLYTILFGAGSGGEITLGGLAVDSLGQTYLAGGVTGNVPTTRDAFQAANPPANESAFVAKFDSTGSRLIYSTYLAGSDNDLAAGIAVDESGNAYVVGYTSSTDFPLKNPYQSAGVSSAFVSKLNATGTSLIFSTYLGTGVFRDGIHIAIDASENVYVTGRTLSEHFPVTPGALQTRITRNTWTGGPNDAAPDAFITKFNPSGTALVFSTYFGGGDSSRNHAYEEVIHSISIDSSNNVYLAGWTNSMEFPQTSRDTACGFVSTAFFTKLDSTGSTLSYSWCEQLSPHGPSTGVAIMPDSSQNAYAAHFYWRQTSAPQILVRKLDATGRVVAEQSLDGADLDHVFDLALVADRFVYITGVTYSSGFPTVRPYQNLKRGGYDAFLAVIDFAQD